MDRRGRKVIPQDEIERVCRLYRSNGDAAAALGIHRSSLGRLCRRYGIETPYVRKGRQLRQARGG